MNCKKCDRLQAEVDELWPFRKRADRAEHALATAQFEAATLRADRDAAEEERDEARANAYNWQATAEEWEKRALDAEPRPLTPDAITDEMIERARQRGSEIVGALWDASVVEAMLTAALTEPPKRPEGAEKVEAVLHQYWSVDIDGDDLADRIAEEMNR